MTEPLSRLKIDQSNIFYNYTIGLAITDVDLLKTARKLLDSGLTSALCFSDSKCLYLDHKGEIQLEWVRLDGRQWDQTLKLNFSPNVPHEAAIELAFSIELLFREQRIEGQENPRTAPYLRAALPPIVLESGDLNLPVYVWIKIYADGIFILSFQLDTTWDGIAEEQWISDFVNLFQCYFEAVWVDERIQRLDADQLLPHAFLDDISIVGRTVNSRKYRKLLKKMRWKSKAFLDDALSKDGRGFEIDNKQWTLHEIAGSGEKEKSELSIDLCRSEYVNAISSLIVPRSRREPIGLSAVKIWQGRPSVSLMRFREQPSNKDVLFKQFGPSMSRILIRSADFDNPPELPRDLRPFGDYCFHGNRSLLLWTWLRPPKKTDDAWDESTTRTLLTENQARSEHFEYNNMRVERACSIAGSPPSYRHLVEAYETLASAEEIIHKSSQAGEISDALSYLMSAVGTARLVPSGKEQARWRLDEFRFRAENRRAQMDRWIGFMFGVFGAAGLADLVFKPYFSVEYPQLSTWIVGLLSFLVAFFAVVLLAVPILVISRNRVK